MSSAVHTNPVAVTSDKPIALASPANLMTVIIPSTVSLTVLLVIVIILTILFIKRRGEAHQ